MPSSAETEVCLLQNYRCPNSDELLLYNLQYTTTMLTTLTSQNSRDLVANSDEAEWCLNDQFATVDANTSMSGGDTY
jgi:hypothetical protein